MDLHTPPSPASTPELRRQSVRTQDQAERHASQRKIVSAMDLNTIITNQEYRAWGYPTLDAYLDADGLNFKAQEAKRRAKIAALPLAPFAGTDFSWDTLEQIASHLEKGSDLQALIKRAQQGQALPSSKAKRTPDQLKPSELAKRAVHELDSAAEYIDELLSRPEAQSGAAWRKTLDARLRDLVQRYGEALDLDLWNERRHTPREAPQSGTNPGGSNEENHNHHEEIIEKNSGSQSPPAPPPKDSPEDPEEAWITKIVRGVVPTLDHDQQLELQRRLVLTLAGKHPHSLVLFVRAVYDHLAASNAPKDLLADINEWIWVVASPDAERRWPEVYNFFIIAKLPGFLDDLHYLKGVVIDSPSLQAELERAWARWPRPEPLPPPPPEGVDPSAWPSEYLAGLSRYQQEIADYYPKHDGKPVSARVAAMAWEGARILSDDLEWMDKQLTDLLGDEADPIDPEGPS